jgi:hypothetical protein
MVEKFNEPVLAGGRNISYVDQDLFRPLRGSLKSLFCVYPGLTPGTINMPSADADSLNVLRHLDSTL